MAGVEETADIQNHASQLQEQMATSSEEDVELSPEDAAAVQGEDLG